MADPPSRQHGDVKHHEEPTHARMSALFPEKGYGFLATPDGREVSFHEHSVLNRKFKQLDICMGVRC